MTDRYLWIFDLDNTLYSPTLNIFEQVDRRMGAFIARYLGLEADAARALQKDYYQRYGTTLAGLMEEHGVDPHTYMAYVHDVELSELRPDPALRAAIERLPGAKVVLTNASRAHAQRVLAQSGLEDVFASVHDIADADFTPKPAAEPYANVLAHHGVPAPKCVMVEDSPRNLDVPHAMGMTTVWVHPDAPQRAPGPPIHYATAELTTWLVEQGMALFAGA